MPHPRLALSVTRHLNATEEEIWAAGRDVVHSLNRTLYGRSDILAKACKTDLLKVIRPLPILQ